MFGLVRAKDLSHRSHEAPSSLALSPSPSPHHGGYLLSRPRHHQISGAARKATLKSRRHPPRTLSCLWLTWIPS
ncbi:hypothetical protein IHE45_12G023600 [Dioscorea alata]|uniref:Uncharacterized protein n=1 Tax=Dioscorea alata TaxID=55571 RepID=A0ACB7V0S7_DIOAL|nr:hypothetical protein IHE45_12G023600 [Dioscorea alata]